MNANFLSARVRTLKGSPTLALGAKAKALSQKGFDVVSLALGEPDWDTLEVAKSAAIQAIDAGFTKYTPVNGIPELRAAIAKQTNRETGLTYDGDQVTVSSGGKFVLFSAFQSLLDPADEVLIPIPYWVSYPTMVELAGGKPVYIETDERSRFKVTAEKLEASISSRTKILILNSPSNPTGEVYTLEELRAITAVLRRHEHVHVVSDDIYNRLFFGGEYAPHLLNADPELRSRTLIVNGASKAFSMTGWRIGWAVGEKTLINAMTQYQSQSVSNPNSIAQKAALAALQEGDSQIKEIVSELKRRRDRALNLVRKVPGVEAATPEGAFYLWLDIRKLLGKRVSNTENSQDALISSSQDFSNLFLDKYYVATVPGIEFGCEGYLRMSYVLSEERLEEAIKRLNQLITSLR